MHKKVDEYVSKLVNRREEVILLREILLTCNLTEDFKWRNPCYTNKGKNIALIGVFKNYCALSFFKGILLKDTEGLLHSPGENSQSVKLFKFKNVKEISNLVPTVKAYVFEAMEVENAGLKVDLNKGEALDFPDELHQLFKQDHNFKNAFETLTLGRQRGYNLFFTGAKQSATRTTRIEKFKPRILDGFGINDCVCGLSKRMPSCDGSHNALKKR